MPWLIVAGVVFFGWQNFQEIRDTRHILEDTRGIADDVKKILCEDEHIEDCNLEQAVKDLKADNDRQTRLITCLMAAHGESQFVTPEVQAECQTTIDSVTSSPTTSPPPNESNQNANDSSLQTNTEVQNPNQNGGGGNEDEPTLREVVIDIITNPLDSLGDLFNWVERQP